ncbi:MAG: substrate-binding domain-containing protein [Prevotella sp.]|nr:substrate-binding domain-containing protein [Prevotella sp.]
MANKIFFPLVMLLLLTCCTQQEKVYRIGVSQCSSGQWREKVNREIQGAQHLYEENVQVSIANAFDDAELQVRQIDSLAATGIDLLVVAPAESSPIAPAIDRVRQRGIPVVFFDRKAATDKYTAFIGGDNVEAGRTMGLYALALASTLRHHPIRISEVTGSMSTSPAQERHQGFAEALASEPSPSPSRVETGRGVVYTSTESDWTSDGAYEAVKKQIEAGAVPDIVFCHNDGMTTGAWRAIEEAGLADRVKVLGIDGMPDEGIAYIQQGQLSGTYIYPTHGEQIVRLALNILTGKPYARENRLEGMMVTPENADITALNSHELLRQNEHLITIHDKLENYFGLYNTQHKLLVASLVVILLLMVAVAMAWRAYLQTRKATQQRQAMNEEQTLFYTDANRRKLSGIFIEAQEDLPEPDSQDMLFAEQFNEVVRRNLSNPTLKVDELGEQMGMSRVQLYRRVKAITGVSPVELLRQMRLQQAYVLLCNSTKTVSEIAYEVGFNTPGYFSKCFREQYGKLPMDLRS